ncbi:MAG: AraC family transcriptional regulator [Sphingomonadaceae bacterium]
MTFTAQVRATALLDFPAVALEAGIDPYVALRGAGIDVGLISRGDMTIPADRVAWLLDGVAEKAGIADLGIRIAMRRRLANLGVAGLVLGQQINVRAALAMAERYGHLLSNALSLTVEENGSVATAIVGVAVGSSAPARQSRELGLAAYVHLFRLLLGEKWAPKAVFFSHAKPRGSTLHQRFFGCPVHFDSSFDGFECPAADLDRANEDADAALVTYASLLLDSLPSQSRTSSGMVLRLTHALLPMGGASLRHVAQAMSQHPRTLQRKLAEEGTAFDIILNEARITLSQELLRNNRLTIDAIAVRLGYAHPSAFIRFFRQQFGVTPGAWRANNNLAFDNIKIAP